MSRFLEEALRLGMGLTNGALRHGGQATWVADGFGQNGEVWQPTAQTLDGGMASGTAGVGSFLAHLATAVGDANLGAIASEALRHSLACAETLTAAGRLGWHEGALGISWAAARGGRLLRRPDLEEGGSQLAQRVVSTVRKQYPDARKPGLLDGAVDTIAGLFSAAQLPGCGGSLEIASDRARSLAHSIQAATDPKGAPPPQNEPLVGLARGRSGLGLVMAAWFAATGESLGRQIARWAFQSERKWFEPGVGWWAPAIHPWMTSENDVSRSWCSGAAGIGIARVHGYVALQDLMLLAEAGAAVEFVRAGLARAAGNDASLCHGEVGEIELLLTAGEGLAEPAHLAAARNAGRALIERARRTGDYGSGFRPEARNPSLMFGLAGVGLTLLRLHEPKSAPSHAVPPFARRQRGGKNLAQTRGGA